MLGLFGTTILHMLIAGGFCFGIGRWLAHRRHRAMRDCPDPLCRAEAARYSAVDMTSEVLFAVAWGVGVGLLTAVTSVFGLSVGLFVVLAAALMITVLLIVRRWSARRYTALDIEQRRHPHHR